ncbi:MAG: sigma-54-dependent Fis family transcriptional regulator [Planctomycetes bacterium]|nr:sigma-54-dependent Fis family transcriptional regulator [Planctomycetota bacterium]MBL7009332.1 sigma-54-dependent Fis family transcriptional regulator [Planctomycetota bacterium]
MRRQRILIVDDEVGMLEVCQESLEPLENIEVETFIDSREAIVRLKEGSFDLLISDIRMPGLGGLDLLRTARTVDPGLPVLLMTGFPSVDTAVLALRHGASDYLTKPFHPDEFLSTVQRLLEQLRLRSEHRLLARHLSKDFVFSQMVGSSAPIRKVFDLVDRVAPSDAPVLLAGETGTGKELVARAVHERSPQAKGRFVPVDCGAIPGELLESEFFGHERGAFTGANEPSIGLMEFADGGTLFLDELAELPLRLQAKLLRTLQEGIIRRVGGKNEIQVKLRIVAATNRDLESMVETGAFREDLYYRLNVVRIDLPPLRERPEDIPLLISHFLRLALKDSPRAAAEMDRDAVEVLSNYHWPGNVRQLQNVIRRAVALSSGGAIGLNDLPEAVIAEARSAAGSKASFFDQRSAVIEKFELEYLQALLERCRGNVVQAAEEASIPRGTLYRLIRRAGIDPASFRE